MSQYILIIYNCALDRFILNIHILNQGDHNMFETIINFLHVAPLAAILALAVAPKLASLLGKNLENAKINTAMLVLSSIGILAGAFEHHHGIQLLDPCFGYAATLAFVAFKISQKKAVKVSVTKE
ncbi:hypothetical protein NF27_EY02150 [Candidatus Jidaibacter acanthamoeba]|uniref:Uncharacterized protein n=2 Tax=Candidatus Jidaibacter acanthamoebae TaxID=86105 RepID=A0A0C1QHY4_9RICK|nr:hypothetical protein NF27_EY02150 [Candidatus Jidaibacter acanthamoeba]